MSGEKAVKERYLRMELNMSDGDWLEVYNLLSSSDYPTDTMGVGRDSMSITEAELEYIS